MSLSEEKISIVLTRKAERKVRLSGFSSTEDKEPRTTSKFLTEPLDALREG